MNMLPDAMPQDPFARTRAARPTKGIRAQFGETMLSLAAEHPGLLALTADLMYATGMAAFGEAYPERLINLGIAEQNMTGVAAGLALCGKLPVVCGYAAFTTLRAVEQAKLDCAYNDVKVILVGQSAGLSYGVGGPTHQTYEDVAIMRAIPNMVVVAPSDAVETDMALRACVANPASAPIYLRLGPGIPLQPTGLAVRDRQGDTLADRRRPAHRRQRRDGLRGAHGRGRAGGGGRRGRRAQRSHGQADRPRSHSASLPWRARAARLAGAQCSGRARRGRPRFAGRRSRLSGPAHRHPGCLSADRTDP